jgi:hypothetical protein
MLDHARDAKSMNGSNLVTQINDVLSNIDEKRKFKSRNTCVTLEAKANSNLLFQFTTDSINIVQLSDERKYDITSLINNYYHRYDDIDHEDVLCYTISFDGYFYDKIVLLVNAIILRSNKSTSESLPVRLEELQIRSS